MHSSRLSLAFSGGNTDPRIPSASRENAADNAVSPPNLNSCFSFSKNNSPLGRHGLCHALFWVGNSCPAWFMNCRWRINMAPCQHSIAKPAPSLLLYIHTFPFLDPHKLDLGIASLTFRS
jgi:hypothetical protein